MKPNIYCLRSASKNSNSSKMISPSRSSISLMKCVKCVLTLVILANLAFTASAQLLTGKIDGIIKDEGQKPVPSATVSLLNARDSSLVKRMVGDKLGHFQFNAIPEGKYLVKASSVDHFS